MSHSQLNEQDDIQKYLEEKAKQDHEQKVEEESKTLSAYDACVLRESDKVWELIAEAQKEAEYHTENN